MGTTSEEQNIPELMRLKGVGNVNSKIVSHRNAIKFVYSKPILKKIIDVADDLESSEDGNLQFSSFQREIFEKAFAGFKYEFCVTSIVETNPDGLPVDISSTCLDLPTDILENYMKVAHLDPLSPVVYQNPGRALTYSSFWPEEKIHQHPFFKKHCVKYGIYRAISLGFLFPAHHNTFIAFDYLGDKNNKSWHHSDHTRLELATFPFVLAWLFRRKQMDLKELSRRLTLLEGLGEHQLQNLRKFVNSPDQNFDQQAESLGIKPGTLKDDLYNTRDIILPRMGLADISQLKTNRSPLRVLEANCSFIRMLGDHTKPIIGM